MPTSDETRYSIDCGVQLGHFGADTGLWALAHVKDPDRLHDEAYTMARRNVGEGAQLLVLSETGRLIEEAYRDWRRSGNDSTIMSLSALANVPTLFQEIVGTCSNYLLEEGVERMEVALPDLDGRYNITGAMEVLRSSVIRANEDLGEWSGERLGLLHRELQAFSEGVYQSGVQAHMLELADTSYQNTAAHQAKWRRIERATRKAIRRSAELLSQIAGESTTRMFLSEGKVVVEGRKCLYEIRRGHSLAHGGAGPGRLLLLDKDDPSVVLCDMCIYTPGVPMMDHVGSLILHIRSGLEDEILKSGNIGKINKEAYTKEWLVPYLRRYEPENYEPGELDGSNRIPGQFSIPRVVRPSLDKVRETRSYVGHWIFERTVAPWAELVSRARQPQSVENERYQPPILLPHEPGYEGGLLQVVDAYCYGEEEQTFRRIPRLARNPARDQTVEIELDNDEPEETSAFSM